MKAQSLTRFSAKLAIAVVAVTIAIAGGLAGEAKAVSAPNSVDGIVNVVYWDTDLFWQGLWPATQRPSVYFYNYVNQYNQIQEWNTGCGPTANSHGTQGFYCGATTNGEIFFDFTQQREQLIAIGDGTVALWMAHEYAHHAERMLGINWTQSQPYHELLADCFAGLYFRWGVYQSKKLAYADYLEARSMLSRLYPDAAHGTPAQRLRAFDYGFARVGYASCTTNWRAW